MAIIKVESFTSPITQDILQKKDFQFLSGSWGGGGNGGGGGGDNITNNYVFQQGIRNIRTFVRTYNQENIDDEIDFGFTENKKILLIIEKRTAYTGFIEIGGAEFQQGNDIITKMKLGNDENGYGETMQYITILDWDYTKTFGIYFHIFSQMPYTFNYHYLKVIIGELE